jgi:hypothetical protein
LLPLRASSERRVFWSAGRVDADVDSVGRRLGTKYNRVVAGRGWPRPGYQDPENKTLFLTASRTKVAMSRCTR